ncbi:hypothetical protein NBRC10512_000506 [Rhodotorula toruloides]|uniref:Aldehyde-lyase domain containing protein n=1 Tax=Rhodotorula toruloides (strain NP11) TaxID=1130832 RepID=M7WKU4_RHOT1|nr:Aldehyde-lyase domain containing protein [Rhodotorula toruloides NP11]EMS18455.1 Aldehyde-lyase domain containing protein [Rhodotorula toruloides NP11]
MDKRLFLRNALRQNKPAVGMWLTMPGTALARTIATVPGLNWILIDGEHGLVTDRDFYEESARSVVSLSKFAPQGIRGCGSPFTHHAFGVDAAEYEAKCNDALLTILQIESREGLENIEEIAAVPGVDVIFIGPFDLAKSMDVKFGGDEHQKAISTILKSTKAAKKHAAIFCATGDQARERLEQGFDMVSVSTDTHSLVRDVSLQLEALKK